MGGPPRAPKLLSFEELAKSHLSKKQTAISVSALEALAEFLQGKNSNFTKQLPSKDAARIGSDLCQLIVAPYDAQSRIARFGHVLLGVSESGAAITTDIWLKTYGSHDPPPFLRFGESKYLNDEILSEKGRTLLPAKFFELGAQAKRVDALSSRDGAFLAHALVEAASARAKIVPPTPI